MPTIHLIHWNAAEAEARAAAIRSAGYEVASGLPPGPDFIKRLRQDPPAAVVIDLSRLPSQGRDMGVALRVSAATRRIPLVFVAGAPEKIERVRAVLPDAVFTTWEQIAEALAEAVANPPSRPVVPESSMAGYSGQPLIKKLGIKPGMAVALFGAPEGLGATLGELPQGASLQDSPGGCELALWFVRSRAELAADLGSVSASVGDVPLWIAWAKKTSGLAADVAEPDVRAAGLASGLVDYKICAIDQTWSGLLFRRRK
jgi:CheY-like chemotaxis protein